MIIIMLKVTATKIEFDVHLYVIGVDICLEIILILKLLFYFLLINIIRRIGKLFKFKITL